MGGIADSKTIGPRACRLCKATFTRNLAATILGRLSIEPAGIDKGYLERRSICFFRAMTVDLQFQRDAHFPSQIVRSASPCDSGGQELQLGGHRPDMTGVHPLQQTRISSMSRTRKALGCDVEL